MSRIFDPPWIIVARDPSELARCCEVLQAPSELSTDFAGTGISSGEPRCSALAAGVEIRLDLWPPRERQGDLLRHNIRSLSARRIAVLFAWRAGGPPDGERRELLDAVAGGRYGAAWVDFDDGDPLLDRFLRRREHASGVRWMQSVHFAREVGDDAVTEAIDRFSARRPDAIKIVLAPASGFAAVEQSARLLSARRGEALTIFGGGLAASASRFTALAENPSAWAYARLHASPGTDPGQPAIETLYDRLAIDSRDYPRVRFGVVGENVAASLSPGFHNRLLRQAGRSELFVDFSLRDPAPLLMSALPLLHGLAVTAPHKRWARGAAPAGDPAQEECPAWNTLRREASGRWVGFNTDGPALLEILEEAGIQPAARVAILGAGGAAQAISYSLGHAGLRVQILARQPGAAPEASTVSFADAIEAADVLINATGAGGGPEAPLPAEWPVDRFAGALGIELVYAVRETAFRQSLQRRGIASADGIEVFARQARLQAQILYGIEIPVARARELTTAACRDFAP